MPDDENLESKRIAGDIVVAYLTKNPMPADDVPVFINSVMSAVFKGNSEAEGNFNPKIEIYADQKTDTLEPEPIEESNVQTEPAVPIDQSIQPEELICLECGSHHKTLKRHLNAAHGLKAADYKNKWNLPSDYPLVAPSYSKKRSELAKQLGLGRKP